MDDTAGDGSTAQWQQAHRLLDAVLRVPPSQRGAAIDALPDASAAVKALLHRLAARAMDGTGLDLPQAGALADAAGDRIGPYVLLCVLGHGGMGEVWLAERPDGLPRRQVALKLPRLSGLGAFEERMARERDILARLVHPHIAQLYDAGITSQGRPYLALEYVQGQPLDLYCQTQRLGVDARLRLFVQVARAVAYAHAQLVIHRDLKPLNVLVDAQGQAKLLDFGIAKLLHEDAPSTGLTQIGMRAFTPEYASPEQLRNEVLGVASDVYALGVLLAELLTGRRPYRGDPRSAAETERAILDGEVLQPSLCTDEPALARALRGDLDTIVGKAMRREPAERYDSAAALADDVERHLRHEPVHARPAAAGYRLRKFVRRHRPAVAIGALALASAVAGVAGTFWQSLRAQEQAVRAEQSRDRALRQLAHAEAMDELMRHLLDATEGKPFTVAELLAQAEVMVDRQFASDAALRAQLLLSVAEQQAQSGARAQAQALLSKAQAAASQSAQAPLIATVECELAADAAEDGLTPPVRARLDAAVAGLRVLGSSEAAALARCLYARGGRENDAGNAQAALNDFREAVSLIGTPRAGQRTLMVGLREGIGGAHAALGDLAGGIQAMKQALEELDGMGRGQTWAALDLLNNVAVMHNAAGNPLNAMQAYDRALQRVGLAADAPERRPMLAGNRADALLALGRTAEAINDLERVHAELVRQGLPLPAATYLQLLAFAWCQAGELARCSDTLAQARADYARHVQEDRNIGARFETTTAELALRRGQLESARDHLQRALTIHESGPRRRGMRHVLAQLGRVELARGDVQAAAAWATRAVDHARASRVAAMANVHVGHALLVQGLVQRAQGQAEAARASWLEAERELLASVGAQASFTREVQLLLSAP
ncbi:serine/threonine-protein kinase [Ideonella sp. A 288]|uniref:serine/threonine-protein kinase n=1 Tax=Ideonella sp. A 288 TaxID=1962181 RepID=UPI000B4A88CA|nr:serine/threonine-protein kinase [Ideonella sp. A 288]